MIGRMVEKHARCLRCGLTYSVSSGRSADARAEIQDWIVMHHKMRHPYADELKFEASTVFEHTYWPPPI